MKFGTHAVINHIRKVIRETDRPSWVGSVPYNFGDAAAGSLKAEEWRIMATIYLPLALVSLWGEGSSQPSQAAKEISRAALDHTMALFSAVHLACLRSTTKAATDAYRELIACYIRDLQTINPRATHKPNRHMALHIYDFILLFGPVRSWWCFPFERLVGLLQRLPTNHKFGTRDPTVR
jgi:hypothetical protein